jgi:hypothetical protein
MLKLSVFPALDCAVRGLVLTWLVCVYPVPGSIPGTWDKVNQTHQKPLPSRSSPSDGDTKDK